MSTPPTGTDRPINGAGRGFTKVYHEHQLGAFCGVHCLNNLLQGPIFGPGDLAEIAVELDQKELGLTGGTSGANCSTGIGDFGIQVLTLALQRFGLELLPATHPEGQRRMADPAQEGRAFVCNYRKHWFTIRQAGCRWWDLDSKHERPRFMPSDFVATCLNQFMADGYCIFFVQGAALPEPFDCSSSASGLGVESYFEIKQLLNTSSEACRFYRRAIASLEPAADSVTTRCSWKRQVQSKDHRLPRQSVFVQTARAFYRRHGGPVVRGLSVQRGMGGDGECVALVVCDCPALMGFQRRRYRR